MHLPWWINPIAYLRNIGCTLAAGRNIGCTLAAGRTIPTTYRLVLHIDGTPLTWLGGALDQACPSYQAHPNKFHKFWALTPVEGIYSIHKSFKKCTRLNQLLLHYCCTILMAHSFEQCLPSSIAKNMLYKSICTCTYIYTGMCIWLLPSPCFPFFG